MKSITKLMLTATLAAGFAAAPAMAGPLDIIKDKAKSEAKKEVRKEMKSQATDKVIGMTGMSDSKAGMAVDGAEKAMEMTGVIDKVSSDSDQSMTDKAISMAKDKMSVKDGSDGAMDSASDMKAMGEEKLGHMKSDTVIQKGTYSTTSTSTSTAPAMAPVACPAGTTAQPDGTCMITGDFNPS